MVLKRFLALFLICSMVATCFISCGNEDNKDKQDQTPNESSAVSDDYKEDMTDDTNDMSDVTDDIKDDLNNAKDNISDAVDDTQSNVNDMINGSSDKSKDEGSLDFPTISDISTLSNKKYSWGQGKNVDENNIPISCTEYQEKFKDYSAYFINGNTKNIYLTFDEGYENGYTNIILDILKEKNCPAIFFVTMPYVKDNPDLIKRMIDEGHIVGNHSVNHKSMPTLDITTATNEITNLHNYVKKTFNYDMTLFRPPMGEFSEQSLAIAKNLGYKTVFWSFAYQDWDSKNQPDTNSALTKTVSSCHNGAIYLLHAVSKTNTQILPQFIDTLRQQGYTFNKM